MGVTPRGLFFSSECMDDLSWEAWSPTGGEKQNQTTRLFVKGKVTYVGAVATRVTENALPALQSRVCLEQVKSLFVQAYLSVNKQVRIKPPKFYQLGKRQS